VVPSLLFVGAGAGRAEEAIRFYTSAFEDSRQGVVARYGPGREPDKPDTIMFADFMLNGHWLAAMDSAQDHSFAFNEAVSLEVRCRNQSEVDRYWERLSEGGEEGPCGWLKDRFGVSWQIVPTRFMEILQGDEGGRERAFQAMLEMKKPDIGKLEQAYSGK
jgi:predicted 3-demethylubiquinone-9 3-methyltransferase (glyoxalase superfamily)